ncbi:hypothetical protein G6F60_015329 [Rhizopus arrhizus]|nr:hypothetical protein G6F60_015329 [Rhizopus arrhizus]
MVSALAPGRLALTRMVGNSASGSGATGSRGSAATPSSTTARVSSVVATGCLTNQLDSETRALMGRPRPWQPVRPVRRLQRRSHPGAGATGHRARSHRPRAVLPGPPPARSRPRRR